MRNESEKDMCRRDRVAQGLVAVLDRDVEPGGEAVQGEAGEVRGGDLRQEPRIDDRPCRHGHPGQLDSRFRTARSKPIECPITGRLPMKATKLRESLSESGSADEIGIADPVNGRCRGRDRGLVGHEGPEGFVFDDNRVPNDDGADLHHARRARIETGRLRVDDDRLEGKERRVSKNGTHRVL